MFFVISAFVAALVKVVLRRVAFMVLILGLVKRKGRQLNYDPEAWDKWFSTTPREFLMRLMIALIAASELISVAAAFIVLVLMRSPSTPVLTLALFIYGCASLIWKVRKHGDEMLEKIEHLGAVARARDDAPATLPAGEDGVAE